MADIEDFDDDFDDGFDDEFGEEGEFAETPSFQEIWDTNPALKLVVGVLGVVVVASLFFIFVPSGEEKEDKVRLSVGSSQTVKHIPGQDELDPVYKKALEDTNKKVVEEAFQTGTSALPTPLGISKKDVLVVDQMPEAPKTDPLAEWRKATEIKRKSIDDLMPEEEAGGLDPSIVPMVQQIRPRTAQLQRDPEGAQKLLAQMNTILASKEPKVLNQDIVTSKKSLYAQMLIDEEAAAEEAANASAIASEYTDDGYSDGTNKIIMTAGTVSYAQVVNELNSDVSGPVLAQVLSGPFAGGRAIGTMAIEDEYMVLTFTRIIKDAVSYKINGIALDEKTTLAAVATDVDRHYFERIILPAAAQFVSGYSSALAERGTTTTTGSGGETVTDTAKASAKESIYAGLEEAGTIVADIIAEDADRDITVKVARGTTFGILFLDTVKTGDVE